MFFSWSAGLTRSSSLADRSSAIRGASSWTGVESVLFASRSAAETKWSPCVCVGSCLTTSAKDPGGDVEFEVEVVVVESSVGAGLDSSVLGDFACNLTLAFWYPPMNREHVSSDAGHRESGVEPELEGPTHKDVRVRDDGGQRLACHAQQETPPWSEVQRLDQYLFRVRFPRHGPGEYDPLEFLEHPVRDRRIDGEYQPRFQSCPQTGQAGFVDDVTSGIEHGRIPDVAPLGPLMELLSGSDDGYGDGKDLG